MRTGRLLTIEAALGMLVATAASGPSASPIARAEGDHAVEYSGRYALDPGGRVTLSNVAGDVWITAWDRDEVDVHAVKTACASRRLREARVEIEAAPDDVRIQTVYDDLDPTWTDDERSRCDNAAIVEYAVRVPRGASLEVSQVRGDLEIEGISGALTAFSVSGRITARGLLGGASLSTIHGRLEVSVDELEGGGSLRLSSIDGSIQLFLPQEADADLSARTLSGGILNDFGLPLRRGGMTGRAVDGVLGEGGSTVAVTSVTGSIAIRMSREI